MLRFNLTELQHLDDPYPRLKELRDAGPLCRGAGPAQWIATRYCDVVALMRDSRLVVEVPEEYRRFVSGSGPAGSFFSRIILGRDPPAHTRLRQLMAPTFAPRAVRALAARIAEMIDTMLAPALDGVTFDIVSELALPLPMQVICHLLGVPEIDLSPVRQRAADLTHAFALDVSASQRQCADAAIEWLRAYIAELARARLRAPRGDLLSAMLTGIGIGIGDEASLEEVVDNAVFLFFAGFETTTNMLATGHEALLCFPDQFALLRADPALVPRAVEEFLRWDAPVNVKARVVREPIELGGQIVRPGRVLVLLLAAANRDERQFLDPDRVDIMRSPNGHVSFGGGLHACLGAALARLEGALVFERVVRRSARLERAGTTVRRPTQSFRALESVPLVMRAA